MLLEPELVLKQLKYTGVLETTRIRREGFPCRMPFKEFCAQYYGIAFYFIDKQPGTLATCGIILAKAQQHVAALCTKYTLEGWQFGKRLVFLKYWHPEVLAMVLARFATLAAVIQVGFR